MDGQDRARHGRDDVGGRSAGPRRRRGLGRAVDVRRRRDPERDAPPGDIDMDGVPDPDRAEAGVARSATAGDDPLLALGDEAHGPRAVEPPAADPRVAGSADRWPWSPPSVRSGGRRGRPGEGRQRRPRRPVVRWPDPVKRVGACLARQHDRLADEPAEEPQVRRQPKDDRAIESVGQPRQRLGAIGAVGDDLGQHRVESTADLVALDDAGIDPDAGTARPSKALDAPGRRKESGLGVLRVEPDLDRMAVGRDVRLLEAERLAAGDPQLVVDEVAPGDGSVTGCSTWRRVFISRNVKLATRVEQELARAGAHVADVTGERRAASPMRSPERGVDRGGAGFLEHLLVPALDRAVALAQMDAMPVAVEEDLDLDVPGALDQAFEDQPLVAEGRGCLAPRRRELRPQARPGRGRSASPCRRRRPMA